jgi:hypothetical protein
VANTIGIIGGTGPEGKGLAARFALAGHPVIIGSRSAERGEEAAQEITALVGSAQVSGADNASAALRAEVIMITVPYAGMADTLAGLAEAIGDKITVCAVVPLQFSRSRVAMLPVADGSAAQEAQRLLPSARVVGAFHNLSASHLIDVSHALDGDVIVCGDDKEAVQVVIEMTNQIKSVRGLNGGVLANNSQVEALTALLINLNRGYKTETQIKITGID